MSIIARVQRLWEFIIVMLKSGIASVFGRLIYRNKGIWLIGERPNQAQDNGYHFFKYLCENHPERCAFYVIKKNSRQIKKVAAVGQVVYHGSWKHWLMYYGCEALISTHIRSFLPSDNWRYSQIAARRKLRHKKYVFLQHGVLSANIPTLYRENAKVDLFICGAKPEFDYVRENYHYRDNEVKYTGLARYDALHEFTVKKQILFMPTWRTWLIEPGYNLSRSEYMYEWNRVITDKRLIDAAKQAGYKIIVYPHHELQFACDLFQSVDDTVIIARDTDYDVQTLLKESALLVTDYSSVYFDFAYMNKPMLFFQFDRERHSVEHYHKSYFIYKKHGFGRVADTAPQLVHYFVETINEGVVLSNKYRTRINRFFPLHDRHNCERIYDEIVKLCDKKPEKKRFFDKESDKKWQKTNAKSKKKSKKG